MRPHLSNFLVGSFRDLRSVELQNLAQINLIVGGNNGGKTSLLEAIAIALSPVDIVDWLTIARSREVRAFSPSSDTLNSMDAIKWLFPHRANPTLEVGPIELRMSGDWIVETLTAHCSIVRGIPPEEHLSAIRRRKRREYEEIFDTEENGLHIEILADLNKLPKKTWQPLLFSPNVNTIRHEVNIWPSTGFSQRRSSLPKLSRTFLSPYSHRNQPLLLRNLSRLIEMGLKNKLLNLLSTIDHDLLDIDIIASEPFGRPTLLIHRKHAGFVPISILGDGFRRALSIALAMVEARDGVLLIDEIETAFHVSVLNRVFPWIVDVAAEFNVQVFASTHSLEAIQAMTDAMPTKKTMSLAAFHLNSDVPNQQTAKRYSLDMLWRLVRDRGLDIR